MGLFLCGIQKISFFRGDYFIQLHDVGSQIFIRFSGCIQLRLQRSYLIPQGGQRRFGLTGFFRLVRQLSRGFFQCLLQCGDLLLPVGIVGLQRFQLLLMLF